MNALAERRLINMNKVEMTVEKRPCDICMRMAIDDGIKWLRENRTTVTGKSFEDVKKIYDVKHPGFQESFNRAWIKVFGGDENESTLYGNLHSYVLRSASSISRR